MPIDNAVETSARRPRVLVADDHPSVLERVVAILADDFLVVGTARDGAWLLEAEATLRPDVLVVDISMPRMNGLEAVARLRRRGSRAAVVFLTALAETDVLDAAFEAGAQGFVNKTCLAYDLVPAIHAVLQGKRFVSTAPWAVATPHR